MFFAVAVAIGVGIVVLGNYNENADTTTLSSSNVAATLTPNSGSVPVSGYEATTADSGNYIANSTMTTLSYEWDSRIRQAGTVTGVKVWPGADNNDAGLTGVWFQVWTKDGSTYDLVGESSNVVTQYKAIDSSSSGVIPVNIPGVSEGDLMGVRVTTSVGVLSDFMDTHSGDTSPGIYRVNAVAGSTDYDWESQTTGAAELHMQFMMAPPSIVFIGDSITAGSGVNNDGYIRPDGSNAFVSRTVPYKVGNTLGISYQNMGDGTSGLNESEDGLARFTEDVVDSNPRVVVIGYGTADINTSVSLGTFSSQMQSMITEAKNANIIPIIHEVYPRDFDTDTKDTNRGLFNAEVRRLAEVNDIPYVNNDNIGDGGTPNALGASYDSGDGIHPNEAGNILIASNIVSTINSNFVDGGWATIHSNVEQQSQAGMALLSIILVAFAAVIIIGVIKVF